MVPWRDIVYGVYGAWRLAHLDRAGMGFFNQTEEGFWRSFFAAVLVAPAYLLVVLLDLVERESQAGALRLLLTHVSAYSLSWTAYPLVIYYLCQAINREQAFLGFIVAFNWAKVVQTVVYLPVIAINAGDVLSGGPAAMLNGVIYILILGYQWFVTRTALNLGGGAAAGLVVLDLVISILVTGVADGLTH